MNLNILSLLGALRDNSHSLLEKIDNDPMLAKRVCPVTGVTVVNASKELFSPKEAHQLYAKGLVYLRYPSLDPGVTVGYEVVGLPYLKMYNYDENEHVRKHAAEMLTMDATPVFFEKLDGTLVSRNEVGDRVMLSTRGMLETIKNVNFGVEEEEAGNQFFTWAYQIIDNKYPVLRERKFADYTLLFELIGPENRIVTFYPEWDLVLTGVYDKMAHRYLNHAELRSFGEANGLSVVAMYEPKGSNLAERIQDLNNALVSTDKEGTVIQFERDGEVVGRIKAKSDTYRTLLRISMNCKYETIAELMDAHPELASWEAMEAHLQELGRHNFPEELMDAYRNFYRQYAEHRARCEKFLNEVIGNCDRMFKKIHVKDYTKGLNREQRKEFALLATKSSHPGAYFAFVDGKLDLEYVMQKVLKEPADSAKAVNVKI